MSSISFLTSSGCHWLLVLSDTGNTCFFLGLFTWSFFHVCSLRWHLPFAVTSVSWRQQINDSFFFLSNLPVFVPHPQRFTFNCVCSHLCVGLCMWLYIPEEPSGAGSLSFGWGIKTKLILSYCWKVSIISAICWFCSVVFFLSVLLNCYPSVVYSFLWTCGWICFCVQSKKIAVSIFCGASLVVMHSFSLFLLWKVLFSFSYNRQLCWM